MHDSKDDRPNILFVDDSKTVRVVAKKILSDQYVVHEAVNGIDAWEQIEKNPDFAVIFVDIQMPEMNGLQLLQNIRSSPDRRIAQKPIIMITGHADSHAAMRAVFEMGATGFVSKPFDDVTLISCACSYISLNQRLDHLEEELGIDRQSGLYNASRFEDEGNKAISLAMRHKLDLSVVYIELKSLSEISSMHGNKIATQVVVEVGKRIEKHLREEEVIARVGTSKFALLLPATSSSNSKIPIARIQNMVKGMTFIAKKNNIHVDIAAGISGVNLNDRDLEFSGLCERADSALQDALKDDGENITVYSDEAHIDGETNEKIQYDKALCESLPHIIDGNFYRVKDERLSDVMKVLEPFMRYANVKISTS